MDMINKLMAGIESEELLDKLIDSAQERWNLGVVVQAIALIITFVLLLGLCRSIIRSKQAAQTAERSEIWPTWMTLGRKRSAQTADGNYAMPAKQLTRWFFSQALSDDLEFEGRCPKIAIRRTGFSGWLARRRIRRLWAIATNEFPKRIDQKAFQKLVKSIADLSRAISTPALVAK